MRAAIGQSTSFQFRTLLGDQYAKFVVVERVGLDDIPVEYDIRRIAVDDRGNSQFGISQALPPCAR